MSPVFYIVGRASDFIKWLGPRAEILRSELYILGPNFTVVGPVLDFIYWIQIGFYIVSSDLDCMYWVQIGILCTGAWSKCYVLDPGSDSDFVLCTEPGSECCIVGPDPNFILSPCTIRNIIILQIQCVVVGIILCNVHWDLGYFVIGRMGFWQAWWSGYTFLHLNE